MSHDVFLSYSSRDKPVADAVCATLEQANVRCWIAPRDILPGKEYGEAIITAIEDCRIFVLIFSSHANESAHVRREVERSISKGKVIVPFRIDRTLPTKAMEFALSNTHWLDALTPPLERHILHLCGVLKAFLHAGAQDDSIGPAESRPGTLSTCNKSDESGKKNERPSMISLIQESPVIRFTNYLIGRALKESAERVHLASSGRHISAKAGDRVIFEMDIPEQMMPAVIGRVKMMANLDCELINQYQHGQIKVVADGKECDLSIIVVPDETGENCWIQFT